MKIKIPPRVDTAWDWAIAHPVAAVLLAGTAGAAVSSVWFSPLHTLAMYGVLCAAAGWLVGYGSASANEARLREKNRRLAEENDRLTTEAVPPVDPLTQVMLTINDLDRARQQVTGGGGER